MLVHDDVVLFEFLVLEGAQAGLSWGTILRKRENPRDNARVGNYEQGHAEQGVRFVWPTICHAHMQATGTVNDHVVSCFQYRQLIGRA